MTEAQLFILADKTFDAVVQQITPQQWELPVPASIAVRQPGISLRKLINYHAYDEAWVPEVLAGRTIAEVGDKYDGDLVGDDPAGAYHKYLKLAAAAVQQANLDAPVHLSYGDYPAREYLQHISSFRGFRAYDLAKFIGGPSRLPDELVQGMWDQLMPHAEEWRAVGVYGPAVPVPETADLQSRLLGLSGRDPQR